MPTIDALRKSRGAYFTPTALTSFLATWAVRSAGDTVLEPSCGEAEFLLAAGRRLRDLGAGLLAGENLRGVELHGPSAATAEKRIREAGLLATVTKADFFDVPPQPAYDAIIGNPPYIRYQDFSGPARTKAVGAALREGVSLNGLASSWAAFVVHASAFLKDEGRLALVLPGELLSVKYAQPVRRFLLRRFESVGLVTFDTLVFPDAQEEVVLLLAEGRGPSDHFRIYQSRDATDLPAPGGATWASFRPGPRGKWLPALIGEDAVGSYRVATECNSFETLEDWGRTYLGAVSGNNRFLTFDRSTAFDLRIPSDELLPISPPGSRHLRGLRFSTKMWQSIADDGGRCFLFRPPVDSLSSDAQRYIEAGEKVGIHKAYKCKVRTPWWHVPVVPVGDLFLTYMDRDRPRLITNEAAVHHLNSVYGVQLAPDRRSLGRALLPLASLNSVTLLGGELVGRAYGGGLLKVEPREADRLPMPSPTLVQDHATELEKLEPQLSCALRSRDLRKAVELVDGVILEKGLGLTSGRLDEIREAREVLFRRRLTRSKRRRDPR